MTRPTTPPPPTAHTNRDSGAARALAETGTMLHQLATHDGRSDGHREDVSRRLALLVETLGKTYDQLPAVLQDRARDVVGAVDRATGRHR